MVDTTYSNSALLEGGALEAALEASASQTATTASLLIKDFEEELMEMLASRLHICAQSVAKDCVRRMLLLHHDIVHPEPRAKSEQKKHPPWKRDPEMNLSKALLERSSRSSSSDGKVSSRTSPSTGKASRSSNRSISTHGSSQISRGRRHTYSGPGSNRSQSAACSSQGSRHSKQRGRTATSGEQSAARKRKDKALHGLSGSRFRRKGAAAWTDWATNITTVSSAVKPQTIVNNKVHAAAATSGNDMKNTVEEGKAGPRERPGRPSQTNLDHREENATSAATSSSAPSSSAPHSMKKRGSEDLSFPLFQDDGTDFSDSENDTDFFAGTNTRKPPRERSLGEHQWDRSRASAGAKQSAPTGTPATGQAARGSQINVEAISQLRASLRASKQGPGDDELT